MAQLTPEEIEEFANDFIFPRLRNGWAAVWSYQLIVFNNIVGYHHFYVRPLVGTKMILNLVREPENPYEKGAIKVVIPDLNDLPFDIRDDETRPLPRLQMVRDIAGETVGRVPGKISKTISKHIDNLNIIHAHAVYTGNITHSPRYGPKLGCAYLLEIVSWDILQIIKNELLNC